MNKILSLILAVTFIVLCAVPAFAEQQKVTINDGHGSADVNITHTVGNKVDDNSTSSDTQITHTVAEGYIITIPESVTLSESGAVLAEISLTEMVVSRENTLNVFISSENYNASTGWNLIARGGFKLPYLIKLGETSVTPSTPVLSCAGGVSDKAGSISFLLGDATPQSVSYTDTLTFTVSVD